MYIYLARHICLYLHVQLAHVRRGYPAWYDGIHLRVDRFARHVCGVINITGPEIGNLVITGVSGVKYDTALITYVYSRGSTTVKFWRDRIIVETPAAMRALLKDREGNTPSLVYRGKTYSGLAEDVGVAAFMGVQARF